jgi:hypothetical protein
MRRSLGGIFGWARSNVVLVEPRKKKGDLSTLVQLVEYVNHILFLLVRLCINNMFLVTLREHGVCLDGMCDALYESPTCIERVFI